MTDAKKRLLVLQRTGEWVFHGTTIADLKVLRPFQAHSWVKNKRIKDGKPCVAAARLCEIAIFMAIVNGKNLSRGFHSGFNATIKNRRTKVQYRLSPRSILIHAKKANGYVYVFPEKLFQPYHHNQSVEWRAYKSVRPISCISVTGKDLPRGIRSKELKVPPRSNSREGLSGKFG